MWRKRLRSWMVGVACAAALSGQAWAASNSFGIDVVVNDELSPVLTFGYNLTPKFYLIGDVWSGLGFTVDGLYALEGSGGQRLGLYAGLRSRSYGSDLRLGGWLENRLDRNLSLLAGAGVMSRPGGNELTAYARLTSQLPSNLYLRGGVDLEGQGLRLRVGAGLRF